MPAQPTPTQIVLPARLASSRLPEKLLQRVGGKSILQHTWEAAGKARCAAGGVIVAVDDPRLAAEVESFGGRWVMTPRDCPSGTDRIAIVAAGAPKTDVFVNVQSDEPEIDPAAIDAVADAILASDSVDMATAATPILSTESLSDPGVVKVVMADFRQPTAGGHSAGQIDQANGPRPRSPETGSLGKGSAGLDGAGQGRAVYFSRALVPHDRDGDPVKRLGDEPPTYWHHLGLYAYRRDFLAWFAATAPSQLEEIERLEQLRAVEAGKSIMVARVGPSPPGIDTPADLSAFRSRYQAD